MFHTYVTLLIIKRLIALQITLKRLRKSFFHNFLAFLLNQIVIALLMAEDTATPQRRSKTPMDLKYTDVHIFQRYVTDTGKILPRRITGLTARQQRHVTRCIKRARNMLLIL